MNPRAKIYCSKRVILKIGGEFMPRLDEGDLLYMPTTLPGVSITKVKEILQTTNRAIKQTPEVELVFGKAGQAETATDPAPMEMFETTVTFKPRDQWRPGMTPDQAGQVVGAVNAYAPHR